MSLYPYGVIISFFFGGPPDGEQDGVEDEKKKLAVATRQQSCYTVCVMMTMTMMRTTTAQHTPIMIIFYREGDTKRDTLLMMRNMRTERSPQTKRRLKLPCQDGNPRFAKLSHICARFSTALASQLAL